MEGSKGRKYFNFPIVLLEGFLIRHKECLNNIFDYAIYVYCINNCEQDIKQAARFFGVTIVDETKTIRNGKALFESLPEGLPKVGINKNIFFGYYENEKTEFEKVTLLAFLAIKSILMEDPCKRLTNDHLIARMDGKSHMIKNVSELSPDLQKYNKEYQFKKIKNELILGWGLKHYGYKVRGFFVSFKMPLADLIFQVEKKKKSNQLKELKEKEEAARIAAIDKLNKK